jgi:hypothetical protein
MEITSVWYINLCPSFVSLWGTKSWSRRVFMWVLMTVLAGAAAVGQNNQPAPVTPTSSIDTLSVACQTDATGKPVSTALNKDSIGKFLDAYNGTDKEKSQAVVRLIRQLGHDKLTGDDLVELAKHKGADEDLLSELSSQAEVYIGWSILPSKVVRDNYGHYVENKFFGADVVIASRSKETIVVNALEFCHVQLKELLRDVSVDPTLVRGSLQKGELTGERSIISSTILAIGTVMSPAAPFFKNSVHRATFSTAAAMFSPLQSAFNSVWPDTIATYLTNWDKDQVFRNGFVVSPGGSTRGRVFIPIEYIYPRPKRKRPKDEQKGGTWDLELRRWRDATHGVYNPEDVKKEIGQLVVLGQQITVGDNRRFEAR